MPELSSSDGFKINYQVIDLTLPWISTPETIIFHHGLGMRLEAWYGWLPKLIDKYRIILFDMRGHGASSLVRPDSMFTMKDLGSDVLALAAANKVDRFHFIGESLGGTVGLHIATKYPKKVNKLVISNTAHIGSAIRSTDEFRQMIKDKGVAFWSEHMMSGRFFEGAISTEARQWYYTEQAKTDADLIIGIRSLLVDTELADAVTGITAPVLLLNGDSSPFIPVTMTADLHSRLSNSQMRIIVHAKHGLPVSHAAECAAHARVFLDS